MVFGKKHSKSEAAPAMPEPATMTNNPPTTMPTPNPSVYHDATEAPFPLPNPHDPSPKYEKDANVPPFQPLKLGEEKATTSTFPIDKKAVRLNGDRPMIESSNNAEVKRSGTWGRGAGTYGPANKGDHSRKQSLAERASTAASGLDDETKGKLSAKERKDAERLSKVIKAEGKAESKHFKANLRELEHLQKTQNRASGAEQAAGKAASKAIKEEHHAEAAYHEAKRRWDKAIANKKATADTLEMKKEHAAATTEQLNRQAQEFESMRERKATDDREREAKLTQLKAALVGTSKA